MWVDWSETHPEPVEERRASTGSISTKAPAPHSLQLRYTRCNACRVTGTNVHVRSRRRRYVVGGRLNTISVSRSWSDM